MGAPGPLTVGLINNSATLLLLVDPSLFEEKECESACCLVASTSTSEILSCELSRNLPTTAKQLTLAAQMAQGCVQEILGLLK